MKVKYEGIEHLSGTELDDLIVKIKMDVAEKVLAALIEKVGFDIGFSLFIYGDISTHYVSNMMDDITFNLIGDVIMDRIDQIELEKKENPQKPN